MRNVNDLPENLPRPEDDGGTIHLEGMEIPAIKLEATSAEFIDLKDAFQKPTVLFIFPRGGSPLEPNKNPDLWDQTPGARGCTPQSCGFRDLHQEFKNLNVSIFGLSIQSPTVQKEFVKKSYFISFAQRLGI